MKKDLIEKIQEEISLGCESLIVNYIVRMAKLELCNSVINKNPKFYAEYVEISIFGMPFIIFEDAFGVLQIISEKTFYYLKQRYKK